MRWPHWQRITSLGACCCQWVSNVANTPAPPWRAALSMRLSQASKSGVCLAARAVASRRTSAVCSSSTKSFFLHHFGHRQIAELFADSHELTDDGFKFTHGLKLLAINGNEGWIAQAHGNGLFSFFAGKERIRAAFDARAVFAFDHEKLFGQRAAAQFTHVGEFAQQLLSLVFEVGIWERWFFHIVV